MSRSRLALLLVLLPVACNGSPSPGSAIDAGDGGPVPDVLAADVGSPDLAAACTPDPRRPVPAADEILSIGVEWGSNGVAGLRVVLPIGSTPPASAARPRRSSTSSSAITRA